jgi:hypothetical protein
VKIVNHTRWQTRDIRAVLARVALTELDGDHNRRVVVTLKPGRDRFDYGHVSGHAILGQHGYRASHMTLLLPARVLDPVSLAATAAHEFAHLRGLTHAQMRGAPRYTYAEGWREVYAWAQAYQVRKIEPKPAPSLDARRQAKLQKSESMIRLWETRVRRAQTWLKKWRRRHARLVATETRAARGKPGGLTAQADS